MVCVSADQGIGARRSTAVLRGAFGKIVSQSSPKYVSTSALNPHAHSSAATPSSGHTQLSAAAALCRETNSAIGLATAAGSVVTEK